MWDSLTYFIERLFVRSFRIAMGAIVLFIAYLLAIEAHEIATKPLASITLAELFSCLFFGILAVWLFFSAFTIAFGEGPSEWDRNKEKEEREKEEEERLRIETEEKDLLNATQKARRTWIKNNL